MTNRLLLKGGALVIPFVLFYGTLAIAGGGITRFFSRLFAGSAYEDHVHGPYTIFTRKGSQGHQTAARVLDEFTQELLAGYGSSLHLKPPPAPPNGLKIHLLERREELEKYGLTRLSSDLANNGGYFLGEKLEIALVLSQYAEANDRGLRHEMMHALMHISKPEAEWPSWLAEGMASYFESSKKVEGTWRPGGSPSDRPRLKSPLRLTQVIDSQSADFMGGQNSAFYDSSHLLVAFLFEKEQAKFFELYTAIYNGEGVKAFDRIFPDRVALEKQWMDYVRDLKQ